MELQLPPGVYVVAVSGGVDSMVMLDLLFQHAPTSHDAYKLVVAHFDHGIRADSHLDRQFVEASARNYGLPFVYDRAELGTRASEDMAREARYAFLYRVQQASGAEAILTAHHQDDLLETAILNILRGTNWRGLASMRSREAVKRPLLDITKAELIAYAKSHGLAWREDSTNQKLRYLRNYIRSALYPVLEDSHKQELLRHIRKVNEQRRPIDTQLANLLHMQPSQTELDRRWFIMLPHVVAREVLATWLKRHGVKGLTSAKLERLVWAAKTFKPGLQADVDSRYVFEMTTGLLALTRRER